MATRNSYLARPNFLSHLTQTIADNNNNNPMNSDSLFEFEESDLWNNSNQIPLSSSETKRSVQSSRLSKKLSRMMISPPTPTPTSQAQSARSLPVNVPDWSKILRNNNGNGDQRQRMESEEEYEDYVGGDDGGDQHDWIPPHEYLARTRGASLSVHEGIGRTLKGRDLRRVRNAIWKKTGFED